LAVELASGSYEQPLPDVLICPAIEDYLGFLKTADRARKTQVKYRGILTVFREFLAKQRVTLLRQFTAAHFDRFRAERKEDHHAKSLYGESVVIKRFMKWCKSRKLIRENPIGDYKLVKPPLVPKAGPNLPQIDSVLASSEGQFMLILAHVWCCAHVFRISGRR
jgi:site-specific recombinase XerD